MHKMALIWSQLLDTRNLPHSVPAHIIISSLLLGIHQSFTELLCFSLWGEIYRVDTLWCSGVPLGWSCTVIGSRRLFCRRAAVECLVNHDRKVIPLHCSEAGEEILWRWPRNSEMCKVQPLISTHRMFLFHIYSGKLLRYWVRNFGPEISTLIAKKMTTKEEKRDSEQEDR